MQTLEIVQMLDAKTNTWSVPHLVPTVAGWKRAVQDVINGTRPSDGPKPDWALHPEDFTAWHTGTWCDDKNQLVWFENEKALGQLSDLVIHK